VEWAGFHTLRHTSRVSRVRPRPQGPSRLIESWIIASRCVSLTSLPKMRSELRLENARHSVKRRSSMSTASGRRPTWSWRSMGGGIPPRRFSPRRTDTSTPTSDRLLTPISTGRPRSPPNCRSSDLRCGEGALMTEHCSSRSSRFLDRLRVELGKTITLDRSVAVRHPDRADSIRNLLRSRETIPDGARLVAERGVHAPPAVTDPLNAGGRPRLGGTSPLAPDSASISKRQPRRDRTGNHAAPRSALLNRASRRSRGRPVGCVNRAAAKRDGTVVSPRPGDHD
jgi:hypothetical protein